jgi:hypothetical protein
MFWALTLGRTQGKDHIVPAHWWHLDRDGGSDRQKSSQYLKN